VATRFCPSCGDEFLASVDECPECEVALVDDRPTELHREDGGEPKTGQIEYELHEWAGESRVMLQSLLNADEIPHVWEGTNLLVPAVIEARVDGMIAQVEATVASPLDPDAPKVAYDIEDWDDALQAELLGLLDVDGIPYEIDAEGALIVLEEDETRVEAAFDTIEQEGEIEVDDGSGPTDRGTATDDPAPAVTDEEAGPDSEIGSDEDVELDDVELDDVELDDDDEDDDDEDEVFDEADLVDLDAQEVMSDLFVAADRLKRKVTDHEGVLTLVERSRDVRRMRLPYGFSRDAWTEIVRATLALNRGLDGDDEEIVEQATALRSILRQYV
jgi:hypothetical protein